MTTLKDTPLHSIHITTTALDVTEARVLAFAHNDFNNPDKADQHHLTLINPGVPIPEDSTAFHGISDDTVKDAVSAPEGLEEVLGKIEQWLTHGEALVGFNIVYDLTVLEYEARRHGVVPLSERMEGEIAPVIDTRTLFLALNRGHRGKKSLQALNENFGLIPEAIEPSDPFAFVIAVSRLLHVLSDQAFAERNVDLSVTEASKVAQWCAQWFQDQNQEYANYLRTRDINREEHVTGVHSGYPVMDVAVGKEPFDYNQPW